MNGLVIIIYIIITLILIALAEALYKNEIMFNKDEESEKFVAQFFMFLWPGFLIGLPLFGIIYGFYKLFDLVIKKFKKGNKQ